MATALSTALYKDGQQTATANQPMGGYKHTGVADAVARNQYASAGQSQDGALTYLTGVSGTNTILASVSPTPAAYAAGQRFSFLIGTTNTGAVTLNVSSLGAKSIKKKMSGGKVALVAADLIAGQSAEVFYDGTDFVLETARTYSQGADVASASTIDLDTATGDCIDVTGTTDITAITLTQGECRTVRFTGILTLTHGASLVLPGAANIITAAGDYAMFRGYASGVVRCVFYNRGTGAAITSDVLVQDFRLTLSTGVPVTTTDVTAAGTVYCTPYKGNRIALYDGARWNIRTSAQFSLALSALTSGRPYDVFCYDNAGTPTLEFLAWTNDTTRATALVYQDGVLVRSGAATRRYMGTFYTTGVASTEDSKLNRYLWNYYHRAARQMVATDTTDSWSYTTATYRPANNNTANALNMVIGLSEDVVNSRADVTCLNSSAGITVRTGIGVDSTSVNGATITSMVETQVINTRISAYAIYVGYPGAGKHTLTWLEYSGASGATTWYGDNSAGVPGQSGITGTVWG